MGIWTTVSVLAGLTLVVLAMVSGGPVTDFLNLPAFLITGGGTLLTAWLSHSGRQLLTAFQDAAQALLTPPPATAATVDSLVRFAHQARRGGLLALERSVAGHGDDFVRRAVVLVVDGTDPELVRNILERELATIIRRYEASIGLFDVMARQAPAFGLVGTLVGLVRMLQRLQEPAAIGPGMATALLTSLYGAVFAYGCLAPLAERLRSRCAAVVLDREIAIAGTLAIQGGSSPRVVQEQLNSFLSMQQRHGPLIASTEEEGPADAAAAAQMGDDLQRSRSLAEQVLRSRALAAEHRRSRAMDAHPR